MLCISFTHSCVQTSLADFFDLDFSFLVVKELSGSVSVERKKKEITWLDGKHSFIWYILCVWVRVSACESVWVRVSPCECVWVRVSACVRKCLSEREWASDIYLHALHTMKARHDQRRGEGGPDWLGTHSDWLGGSSKKKAVPIITNPCILSVSQEAIL